VNFPRRKFIVSEGDIDKALLSWDTAVWKRLRHRESADLDMAPGGGVRGPRHMRSNVRGFTMWVQGREK
jgi:hypothetical protein